MSIIGEKFVFERTVLEVVQVSKGVIFTGDFPHAGAVNYDPESKEDTLTKGFHDEAQKLMTSAKKSKKKQDELLKLLATFQDLNKISRFFCTTIDLKADFQTTVKHVGLV
jgi:hypothetical protein